MRRAFTLVEIMVVVGIVIILITLTLPNILRSRMVAIEAAAIANLKIIANACQTFHMNTANYPTQLNDLIQPVSDPPYIDSVLAGGNKQSYSFTYSQVGDGFTILADPTGLFDRLNARHFCVDESGTIHSKTGGQAGPNDTPVL